MNIGASYNEDLGLEKVIFNTDEWYEMFAWAFKEANRLGISIGVHNCDGWSTSGGPWITLERAMKKFVYTKTWVEENQEHIKLKNHLLKLISTKMWMSGPLKNPKRFIQAS